MMTPTFLLSSLVRETLHLTEARGPRTVRRAEEAGRASLARTAEDAAEEFQGLLPVELPSNVVISETRPEELATCMIQFQTRRSSALAYLLGRADGMRTSRILSTRGGVAAWSGDVDGIKTRVTDALHDEMADVLEDELGYVPHGTGLYWARAALRAKITEVEFDLDDHAHTWCMSSVTFTRAA